MVATKKIAGVLAGLAAGAMLLAMSVEAWGSPGRSHGPAYRGGGVSVTVGSGASHGHGYRPGQYSHHGGGHHYRPYYRPGVTVYYYSVPGYAYYSGPVYSYSPYIPSVPYQGYYYAGSSSHYRFNPYTFSRYPYYRYPAPYVNPWR